MLRGLAILAVVFLGGCSQNSKPPAQVSSTQPPTILVHTEHGWVAMSSREAASYPATMPALGETVPYVADIQPENENRPITDEGYHGGEFRHIGRMAWRVPRPRVDSVGPVSPQYYYVRPEYTPQGYIPGQYGRIDNFTPGQYTTHGYEQGHYRADGLYTRPEYTPQGYIPGHWRADTMPFGQATPPVTPSSPAHR